ncbi:MAG TPA: hypothetical protein VGO62_08845, partial [Myxococcota bacterium]
MVRAGFIAAFVVALALASSSAHASPTFNQPPDQTLVAGQPLSNLTNLQATDSLLNTIQRWTVRAVTSSGGVCTATTAPALPELTASFTTGFSPVHITIAWPGEATAYSLGTQCLEIAPCDVNGCTPRTVKIVVNKAGEQVAMKVHDQVLYPGDEQGQDLAIYGRNVSLTASTPASSLLSLVSCPSGGAGCSPPALPPWIGATQSATRFAADPPFGTATGDWIFRASPPAAATTESEPNNSAASADALTSGTTIAGTLSTASDVDMFAFNTVAGEASTLKITGACPPQTILAFVDTDGSTLMNSSSTCSNVTVTPPTSGVRFARIFTSAASAAYSLLLTNPADIAPTGAKNFKVRVLDRGLTTSTFGDNISAAVILGEDEPHNNSISEPAVIPPFGIVRGDIFPAGDTDLFQFYARPGVTGFEVAGEDQFCPGAMTLSIVENTAAGLVTRATSSSDPAHGICAAVYYDVPSEGFFYVKVAAVGAVDGYILFRNTGNEANPDNEPNNTFDQIGEFMNDFVGTDGQLSSASDVDYEQFTGPVSAGSHVSVRVTGQENDVCPRAGLSLHLQFDNRGSVCGALPAGAIDDVAVSVGVGSVCPSLEDITLPCTGNYAVFTANGPAAYRIVGGVVNAAPPPLSVPDSLVFENSQLGNEQTVTYGKCNVGAFTVDDEQQFINASSVALYDVTNLGSSLLPTCGGASSTAEFDNDGVCRLFDAPLMSDGDEETRQHFTPERLDTGRILFSPLATDINKIIRLHAVAMQRDAVGSRAIGSWAGGSTILRLHVLSGGNDMVVRTPDECDTSCAMTGCPLASTEGLCADGKAKCIINKSYREGDHFRLRLERYNRLITNVVVARCTSIADSACTQPLNGVTYDVPTDELRWDVPDTAGTTTNFFRIRSTGDSSRGESTSDFYVQVGTIDVTPFSGTGADLYPAAVRPSAPAGFSPELDDRVSHRSGEFLDVGFDTNTSLGRSLLQNDLVPVRINRETANSRPHAYSVDVV